MKRGKTKRRAKYFWIGGILIGLILIISGVLWMFTSESDQQPTISEVGALSRYFPDEYLENISLRDLQKMPSGTEMKDYSVDGVNKTILLINGARGIYFNSEREEESTKYAKIWVEQTKEENYEYYKGALIQEIEGIAEEDSFNDFRNKTYFGHEYYLVYTNKSVYNLGNATAAWADIFFPEDNISVLIMMGFSQEPYEKQIENSRRLVEELIKSALK